MTACERRRLLSRSWRNDGHQNGRRPYRRALNRFQRKLMNLAAADDRCATFGLANRRADGEPIGAPARRDDIQVGAAQRRGWRPQTERKDQQGPGDPDRRVHIDIVLNGTAGCRFNYHVRIGERPMNNLSRRSIGTFIVAFAVAAGPTAASAQVKVIISGGFSAAFRTLLPEFEKSSGVSVTTTTGGSQGNGPNTIGAQLRRGVPADVV